MSNNSRPGASTDITKPLAASDLFNPCMALRVPRQELVISDLLCGSAGWLELLSTCGAGARRTELRGECLKALSSEREDGDGEPRVRKETSPLRVSTNRITQSLISLLMSGLVLRQTDCWYFKWVF